MQRSKINRIKINLSLEQENIFETLQTGMPIGTVDRIIRKDVEVKSVSKDAVLLIAKSAVIQYIPFIPINFF